MSDTREWPEEQVKEAVKTPWELCTEEQREIRRRQVGEYDGLGAWDSYHAELVRRYRLGMTLSLADRKLARRLLKGA